MLERNLCQLCQRNCSESAKTKCLTDPKLNLGSGLMLTDNYINYDMREFQHGDLVTDIIGTVENMSELLPADCFQEIFCSHVIEHFFPEEATKLIQDCYSLLRPKGKLIMEGPDVEGTLQLWNEKHSFFGDPPDIRRFIAFIYGDTRHRQMWGEGWWHKWGWTKDLVAEEMEKIGFVIVHKGIGLSHGMGKRDFRVEGWK